MAGANSAGSAQGKTPLKRLLAVVPVLLLLVSVYFVYIRASSYGQNSIEVLDDPTIIGFPLPSTAQLPKDAWFNRTLKSWFRDGPTVQEIVVRDIEAAGGWAAMKKHESLEIKGEHYNMSCQTLLTKDQDSILSKTRPELVSMTVKAPSKFYRRVDAPYYNELNPGEVRTTHYNGKEMVSCSVFNSRWRCDPQSPDTAMPMGFVMAATDYSQEFRLHNWFRLEEFKKRVVYMVPAYSKHPFPGELIGYRRLRFDAVTGRLAAVEFPQETVLGFEDYRKVGSISLPHKICIDRPGGSEAMVITSWNFDPAVDDELFERPDKL